MTASCLFPRWLRILVVILIFGAAGVAAAADDSRGVLDDLRQKFKKETPVEPEEELFRQAEENYHGRETLLGKAVGALWGRDSTLYTKGKWMKRKNESTALELYQKLVDNYPFSKHAALAQLRVADCSYSLENWEEARINYELFIKLHPKAPEVPYALLRQGECHYQQKEKPGRDQDQTRQAALVFAEVISRYPGTPEATEAAEKLAETRVLLAKHELIVADFYFKRKDYWAAAARYRGVWQNFSGLGFDSRARFMEGSCYEGVIRPELALEPYRIAAAGGDEYSVKAAARLSELEREQAR